MIELDHIGIAVKSIDSFSEVFKDLFDIEFKETLSLPTQKLNATFSEHDSKLELIEAVGDKSPYFPILEHPILSHINKHGEGVHHLCFSVDNLENYVEKLEKKNVKLVGNGIMTGSYGHKVCFINPAHTNGLLIELKQK